MNANVIGMKTSKTPFNATNVLLPYGPAHEEHRPPQTTESLNEHQDTSVKPSGRSMNVLPQFVGSSTKVETLPMDNGNASKLSRGVAPYGAGPLLSLIHI